MVVDLVPMPGARAPGSHGIVWASFLALLLATPVFSLDPGIALTQYGHTLWRVRDGYFSGRPGGDGKVRLFRSHAAVPAQGRP